MNIPTHAVHAEAAPTGSTQTQQAAADHAVEINPVNAPRPMVALPPQQSRS